VQSDRISFPEKSFGIRIKLLKGRSINMRNITNALDALRDSIGWMLASLTLAVLAMSVTAIAAPSNLDPTFGVLGKVISTPDGTPTFTSSGMALQSDGKIVIVGNRVISGSYAGMIVARYNANGSLDTAFGNGGWNSVGFGESYEFADDVGIQSDGKIVIGGALQTVINNIPSGKFGIARFTAEGQPDPMFDNDGKMVVDFNDALGSFYHEFFSSLKIAPDGKIVAGGEALNSGVDDRFVLCRINTDGSLDATFGINGKVADIPRASNHDHLGDLVVLPDGAIVYVGFHYGLGGSKRIAAKFNASGVKQWEYNVGPFGWPVNDNERLNGIAAQPDGKLIVVGKRGGKIAAIRLNADGTEDTSFVNPASMPTGQALAVAIEASGKIIATVESAAFSLVRFNADGSLDSTFGVGGFSNTDVSSGGDYPAEVLVQADGKILVGGTSQFGSPTGYYISMVRYLGASASPSKPQFDYDGDGRADISVFRPSENRWYILRSSDQSLVQQVFAISNDVPVPSDYDGDGKTDVAIYRPASFDWWFLSTLTGAQTYGHWGEASVIPRPSDIDGDGKSDYVVYNPATFTWLRWKSTFGTSNVVFGSPGDKPVVGDFDGDGKSDVAIYRPSTGDWWYGASSNGGEHRAAHWGISTDTPAPADYDGDGKTDLAVYRASTGVWYIANSSDGSSIILNFGLSEDKPVPADYDGDGKADIAVFRPSTGTWYLMRSTAGFSAVPFGISTDVPTPNAFVP
jgi:uncharacterized delta-60 repeat protein